MVEHAWMVWEITLVSVWMVLVDVTVRMTSTNASLHNVETAPPAMTTSTRIPVSVRSVSQVSTVKPMIMTAHQGEILKTTLYVLN